MNKRGLVLGCMLSVSSVAPLAHAVDGLTLEFGLSSESTETYRVAGQFDFGQAIWQSQRGSMRLGGYWDMGLTRWAGLDANTLSVSPVLVLEFGPGSNMVPYIEAGIGAAYFTRSNFRSEERDLGSRLLFEDRFGAGVRFPTGTEIGLRIYHYSNAGIRKPNNGIETAALHYRFSF